MVICVLRVSLIIVSPFPRVSLHVKSVYRHDSGSLSSVNLLKNNIGDEQMQSLIKIKKEKGMASLCGLHQGQTEADFSNQGLGAEDVKLIASDIQDMGALASLTISNNQISSEQEAKIKEICAGKSIKCAVLSNHASLDDEPQEGKEEWEEGDY